MSIDLEKLREELKMHIAKNERELAIEVEAARIKAEIAVITNPDIKNARVAAEVDKLNTQTLDSILTQANIVVDNKPIIDAKKREPRKFAPSRFFGLGAQIDKVYQILTGILYASEKHKPELLALTKLDINLIETTVEAFGQPESFYNGTLRPQVLPNTTKLRANLALISTKLNLTLDLSNITVSRMESILAAAKAKAAKDNAEYIITLEQDSQTIEI